MASSPSFASEKKRWWLGSRKVVEKYIREARALISTQDHIEVSSAINLLDAALALSPGLEIALELKARALLHLRRVREIADMLEDYIPSCKPHCEDGTLNNSSELLSKDRVKLLSTTSNSWSKLRYRNHGFKCFSVSDLKKKVFAGSQKSCEKEGEWRYLILGQACYHLGLMEDAMVLLRAGKRLASAACRRQSISLSEDSFSLSDILSVGQEKSSLNPSVQPCSSSAEFDAISNLLVQIKLLLRRRSAAIAALNTGAHLEAIRHFSKILESRRKTPQGFLAECYIGRAGAYHAAGRIAEAIADCNRALALDSASISALTLRATLLELIGSLPDCLRDLGHLKLLYDTILRDRKLPGPAWKQHPIRFSDVPSNLRNLNSKISELRRRMGSGGGSKVDYYALIGIPHGCTRSALERAHLLLSLRHRPDKTISFIDRCEFVDDRDVDAIREQARMSALLLYRLLQKGYSSVMSAIIHEEASERKKVRGAPAIQHYSMIQKPKISHSDDSTKVRKNSAVVSSLLNDTRATHLSLKIDSGDANRFKQDCGASKAVRAAQMTPLASVAPGAFCRDVAGIGNLFPQVGFSSQIPMKCEALSC